jgi:hypothetical protein
MGLLDHRRLDDEFVECVTVGLVGPALGFGKRALQQRDRFFEDFLAVGHLEAEPVILVGPVAATNAEIIAPLRQLIDRRNLFGQ